MTATQDDVIQVGFRFDARQAPILRAAARNLASIGFQGEDIEVLDKAADAAEKQEPLIVLVSERAEIEMLKAIFTNVGAVAPAVDDMRSDA